MLPCLFKRNALPTQCLYVIRCNKSIVTMSKKIIFPNGIPVCRKCGCDLIIGKNITQNMLTRRQYTCRSCRRDQQREYRREYCHRTGLQQPMNENKRCSAFLGVYVAERVLSHVFKHVEQMPYGNPGFDFRCGRNYMIDVKSSCRRHHKDRADSWMFAIRNNQIAEYFLCLAFDNRNDINPEHIWLIPANQINDHASVNITESRLSKWDEYKLDINKVSACCNIMKLSH